MNPVGGGVMWNKPPALLCHICGREYGTTSLAIHLPQCAKLWKDRQKLLPRSERRPVPKAPLTLTAITAMKIDSSDTAAMEEFNRTMMGVFVEKGLVGCQHCGRRFLVEKLPIHQRSCTAERPAAAVGSHRLKQQPPPQQQQGAWRPSTAAAAAGGGGGRGSVSFAPVAGAADRQMKAEGEEVKMDDDIPLPSKGYDLSAILSAAESDGAGGGGGSMSECGTCGRRFNSDRIAKHEAVCAKTYTKPAARPHTVKPAAAAHAAPVVDNTWKSKHNDFQQALRYAKQLTAAQQQGIPLSSLPPPPPAANPDYVQCPHCQRRFAPQAAERHIPACKNTINKPKPPPTQLSRPMTGGGVRGGAMGGGKSGMSGAGGMASVSRPAAAAPPAVSSSRATGLPSPSTASNRTSMPPISPNRGPAAAAKAAAGADMHNQLKQLTATVAMLAAQVNGGQCKNCKVGLSNGARFCSQCGTPQ